MCGIVGILANRDISDIVFDSLKKLQHRGRESFGVATIGFSKKVLGLVREIPIPVSNVYLGHTRYSTSGLKSDIKEAQPFDRKDFILIHNGNIPDVKGNDTIFIIRIIESCKDIEEGLKKVIAEIKCSYSLIVLDKAKKCLYIARDRYGIRPLCIGKTKGGYAFCSETSALPNGYSCIGDVDPGTVLKCTHKGIKIIFKFPQIRQNFCVFEKIYFMNHNSFGVYNYRYTLGFKLGKGETSPNQDGIVVCVPNTAIAFAEGFAEATNQSFDKTGIQKIPKTGRTFILPENHQRIDLCKRAFSFSDSLKNKIVYLVDDSLVRGNTMRAIIEKLKIFGVKEIHVRIGSPPVTDTCSFGIDIPTKQELAASKTTVDEIKTLIGADSLRYLDVDELGEGCKKCFGKDFEW